MSFSPGDYDPTLNPNPGARAPPFFRLEAINSISNAVKPLSSGALATAESLKNAIKL
jgi:hypothetical protein